jgi:hypothetical protein
MPGHTTTVQRLERKLQLEHAQALAALHERYTALLAELFPAARSRGWQGNDPVEAVRALTAASPEIEACGRAAADLWLSFFGCFRDDEAAFEAKQFTERATPINRDLGRRGAGRPPDGDLTIRILTTLDAFLEERHAAVSQRIDALLTEIAQAQHEARKATLGAAQGTDDLGRVDGFLADCLAACGVPDATGTTLDRMRRLVEVLRNDAGGARARTAAAEARLATVLGALQGQDDLGSLPPEAVQFLGQIRRLVEARKELEQSNRELHARLAESEGQRRELLEQLSAAEQRLADPAEEHGEDRRLALYRAVAAAMESGGDWRTPLEKVRSIERVLRLDGPAQTRLVKLVDRQLGELARTLADLRAISELTPDPRRLRPRLFGSDYDFKSLSGILPALRDAADDLAVYADRVRWAQGVQALGRRLPHLRSVFRELVALVAAWRAKLGDAPPASLTIALDAGSGLLALPAVLAADLEQLLKRRKAAAAALELAPLIDAGVALYHQAVSEARGEAPNRSVPAKRESSIAAVSRLASELTALAGMIETAFAEAARDEFRLGTADNALLSDDHLIRLGLTQIDPAVAELAVAPGSPPAPTAAAPARGDGRALHGAVRSRADWLALLVRHRIES